MRSAGVWPLRTHSARLATEISMYFHAGGQPATVQGFGVSLPVPRFQCLGPPLDLDPGPQEGFSLVVINILISSRPAVVCQTSRRSLW